MVLDSWVKNNPPEVQTCGAVKQIIPTPRKSVPLPLKPLVLAFLKRSKRFNAEGWRGEGVGGFAPIICALIHTVV